MEISPGMFKPMIGKGHPEFSIRNQQMDNNGEEVFFIWTSFQSFILRYPGVLLPTRHYKKRVSAAKCNWFQLKYRVQCADMAVATNFFVQSMSC